MISIVTPVFNGAKFIEKTVESIFAQDETNWELILVNDGSTDRTEEVLQRIATLDRRVTVLSLANQGPSAARNAGLAATNPHYDFVIFLDADDLWLPHTLSVLLKAAQEHPECVGAHGVEELIDEYGRTLTPDVEQTFKRWRVDGNKSCLLRDHEPTGFSAMVIECTVKTPGSALLRKSAVLEINGYDNSVRSCEDYDLWLRILNDRSLTFVRRTVLGYRRHPYNASTDPERVQKTMTGERRKALKSPLYSKEQKSQMRRGYKIREFGAARYSIIMATKKLFSGDLKQFSTLFCYSLAHTWKAVRGL